ncbi:sugar phosphate isomerase/epimerase [soil metagenome]
MASNEIGVQLYTLRALGAEDFPGMLAKVAGAGYGWVEFAGYGGLAATELKSVMDGLGLKTIGAHVPITRFDTEIETVIEELHTLEAEYAIVPWLAPEDRPTDRDGGLRLAEQLSKYGEKVSAGGLKFAYHNHDFELAKVDGETTILDLIASETDPAHVSIELDIYWAYFAGGDSVSLTERYAGRVPLIHAKDLRALGEKGDAPVGEGVVDWPGYVPVARAAGVKWFIVEQDTPNPDDTVGDVARSYANLEKFLA